MRKLWIVLLLALVVATIGIVSVSHTDTPSHVVSAVSTDDSSESSSPSPLGGLAIGSGLPQTFTTFAPTTTTTIAPAPKPKPKTTTPKSSPAPAAAKKPVSAAGTTGGSVWDRIATCESHNDWTTHTASGFSGGLQFADSSWRAYGGTAFAPVAWQASREQQITVAERILASAHGSYHQGWPACSRKLGLP